MFFFIRGPFLEQLFFLEKANFSETNIAHFLLFLESHFSEELLFLKV